jgi:hypothetical protein
MHQRGRLDCAAILVAAVAYRRSCPSTVSACAMPQRTTSVFHSLSHVFVASPPTSLLSRVYPIPRTSPCVTKTNDPWGIEQSVEDNVL